MAYTNSRLEIWCGLKINADARASLWPTLIGQFSILSWFKSHDSTVVENTFYLLGYFSTLFHAKILPCRIKYCNF